MKILAIETSCDETAAAVVENGTKILSNVVVSQIDLHAVYGGVIPELAARSHIEAILPVIRQALAEADLTWSEIDALAVTDRPGLIGSLLIGTLTARTLAILHEKPLYPVHHLKSHIYANWLSPNDGATDEAISDLCSPEVSPTPSGRNFCDTLGLVNESICSTVEDSVLDAATSAIYPPAKTATYIPDVTDGFAVAEGKIAVPPDDQRMTCRAESGFAEVAASETESSATVHIPEFPLLALVISGGHTQIIKMPDHNTFEIIGTTRDDAVGECFDKVAKILGLPYPGGPSIAKAAETGDETKYPLPIPKVENLDFSFSGLKTAVLRAVQKEVKKPISFPSHELAPLLTETQKSDFAASFQTTAIKILLEKLTNALKQNPETKSLLLAGGVSANKNLRKAFLKAFSKNYQTFIPEPKFSTDNAAMVGSAAYFESLSQPADDPYRLEVSPSEQIS